MYICHLITYPLSFFFFFPLFLFFGIYYCRLFVPPPHPPCRSTLKRGRVPAHCGDRPGWGGGGPGAPGGFPGVWVWGVGGRTEKCGFFLEVRTLGYGVPGVREWESVEYYCNLGREGTSVFGEGGWGK